MRRYILWASALALTAPAMAQKDETLALTPPMGWNSWNHYGCNIDEALIKATADALVSTGLREAGYTYVNLDDCWHGARDDNGNIQPDPERFPSGMKALGDYLHERGLKFGIYSDAGAATCAGRPGSQGYEFQDAAQYASWGVDYVKYDWCNTGNDENQRNPREAYATMSRAIAASGRPMVLSICEWGENDPWLWGDEFGHLWRTTGDITNCWDCVVHHGNWQSSGILPILDQQMEIRGHSGPGGWNDPDMMEVGNLPTLAQNRSHFAMWAMLSAPLIIGTDVPAMSEETRQILGNQRVIALNQDESGISAMRWLTFTGFEIWAKPLANGEWAIAALNRESTAREFTLNWSEYPLEDNLNSRRVDFARERFVIEDSWDGSAAGTTAEPLDMLIEPHDTLVFRLRPLD